jgi:hypothetical protein
MTKRATPEIFCDYKMASFLYQYFKEKFPEEEWLHINSNIVNISRQTKSKTL